MFSNTRIIIAALLLSFATFAQETETETLTQTEKSGRKVGNIVFGAYIPIAFGDNFVNNGMDLHIGAKFAFKLNVMENFYVGPYLSLFDGSVTNRELLGNYSTTTNVLAGGILGYEKEMQKFDLSMGLGVGASIYANKGADDNFNDTGVAVWLDPEVSYRISTYWAVFIAPQLRHDFMNIDAPEELKDTFKGVNYFTISFGLRINLGTGYKNP